MLARRRWLSMLALALLPTFAAAQDYPNKQVRVVVPWVVGGGADAVARVLGQKLNEMWNQPVIVDNRGGATGTIGTDLVAKAPGDGYTLLLGNNSTYVYAVTLYKKLPYDPEKDLTPISRVAEVPHVLSVHPSVPVKTAKELVEYIKANPGKLSFGSSGTGSTPHVAGELFMNLTGTKLLHVPYKGAGQSVADTVSGQVQVSFDTLPSVVSFIQAGRLRPLAVLGPKRVASLPDVPTSAEAGFPGAEGSTWYGLYGPANMPPAVVKKIHDDVAVAVKMPDVKARLDTLGAMETASMSSEELKANVKAEVAKYATVLKNMGVEGQ